jgi:hypothetical protein
MRWLYWVERRTRAAHAQRAAAWVVIAALVSGAGSFCFAETPANVLAEFDVARRGDLLTLPVAIATSTYKFALGTHHVAWVFDESLRNVLGDPADAPSGRSSELPEPLRNVLPLITDTFNADALYGWESTGTLRNAANPRRLSASLRGHSCMR